MQSNMKKNPFAGSFKVFRFSLKQNVCSKGWLISTLTIALLLLLGIPLFLYLISAIGEENENQTDDETNIRTVFVVDETEGEADYNVLHIEDDDPEYIVCASMDAAIGETAGMKDAVILRVSDSNGTYLTTVYLTQNTEISRSKASVLGTIISMNFQNVLLQKAGLTPEGAALLSMPVLMDTAMITADSQTETEDQDIIAEAISTLLPYMIMFLIYMMIVFYGQSMANSVMLEKTSKLMETILVAVNPTALMTGKLFATASAAIMQILVWLGALIGGLAGGSFFALSLIPQTDNATVRMIDVVSDELFSLSGPGILMSIVILALGFLLYLSLSAIAGAMANKVEELNKTNVIFMMVLIGSMILCFVSPSEIMENADAGTVKVLSDALWIKLFPFTAILITPGALITRSVSLLFGCGTIVILFASVILLTVIAAAIYKTLVLYRGEPPKIKQLIAMVKENRSHKKNSPEQ